ncbi:MAG: peptidase C1A papain [Chitinophagaceae bacterium]|nr:peptidase C1A papain [Chitinophagaceae bacterium]
MPIRMTDDPRDPNQRDYNDDRGGGGGGQSGLPGGGLGALLPLLLGLFKGKGIIFLLVIAAGAYFLLGKSDGCNLSQITQTLFSQSGYSFDPNEFNKASVYEGLEDDNAKNPLPESVSLLKYAPARSDQGQQGSCVAWSCAYAAQTILTAAARGDDPNQIVFSPSYLYNQIKLEGCQGSYLQRAMEAMRANGGVALREYPYDDSNCDRMPTSSDVNRGKQNTIHGFSRLTQGDNINKISIRAIKEHLAKDAPVAIGMMVGQSFMQNMMGQELWQPSGMDASQVGMGGHAMCVIGYDDRKFGGAFQIMNSWGPQWGKDGVAWVRYGDFQNYVREAYGIDPLPKSSEVANKLLSAKIGLVRNDNKQYIRLQSAGGNNFETVEPISAGTRFKMEINNETPCYVYIFSREADGSSFTLFPYNNKHYPYCGITGYRLFPKEQSMEADTIGNRDYIAVVVSRDELPYEQINNAISTASGNTYAEKVNNALQSISIRSARYNSLPDGRMDFKVNANDNKAVVAIVAFDKQ